MFKKTMDRRLLFGRRVLFTVFFGLLVPVSPPISHMPVGTEQQTVLLLPYKPGFRHLPAGSCVPFAIDAQPGNAAEILLETSTPGAVISIVAPDGTQLPTVGVEQAGWRAFSFPLTQLGQYRLVVQARAAEDGGEGTSVHAEFLPFNHSGAQLRAQAEAIFSEAQSLAASPHSASLHSAIDKYSRAESLWSDAGDREGDVLALAGQAKVWLDLSEYAKAFAALHRARLLSPRIAFFRAWLSNIEAEIYLDRWDSGQAMRSAQEAMRLSRGLDDWLGSAAFAARGEAEYLAGDPGGRKDIEDALRLSRDISASATLARALRCRSWMESDQGHLTSAMALMREAEEQFHKDGEVRDSFDAMANLATIQGMNGDHYSALVRHSSIGPLIEEAGKRADYAFLLLNTANDYGELNRVSDAIVYYDQASRIFHTLGIPSGESIVLSQLCMAETRINRLHDALHNCTQARTIAKQLKDPKRVAVTIWRLGRVQCALRETEQAIASFQRAEDISKTVGDRYAQAQSLMDRGDTLESVGRREEARELFRQALPLSEAAEDAPEQLEVRYRIARSEFEAGDGENARHDLAIALESVNVQRRAVGNPDLQASYFAQLRKCHELLIELLMRGRTHNRVARTDREALTVSESSRALTLLDTLAARDRALGEQRQDGASRELFALNSAVESAYDERLKLMLEGGHKHDIDVNEARLTQAIDAVERAEDEQRAVAGDFQPAGKPLSATEIATASRELRTTLVEYALGSEQSYVWVVNSGKIESHVLPRRKVVESAAKEWRLLVTARIARPGESFEDHRNRIRAADQELPRVAAHLSCMLLAPFLRSGMKRLAIVPDGELALLPFEALPENGCGGGGQPLAADREVVVTPSLSILLMPHQPLNYAWRGDIALLADPVFDRDDPRVQHIAASPAGTNPTRFEFALSRLFGTRDEAKAITGLAGPGRSALYVDFDASLQTLLNSSLGEYRILHLATHGILDESSPELSGLVFSLVSREGEPVFGFLKRHDIESLNLRSDLVVLSSCDSGEGINLSGEGVTGLNYAFLSAGAARVVSTLWSVDDDISTEWMVAFYEGLLREGLDPGEALQKAQLKIMHNPDTAAPFYWAGFSLTTTID